MDSATEEVDGYVQIIKHNYEIGGVYMTVGDLMDKIVADAVADKDAELADKDAELADMKERIKKLEGQIEKLEVVLNDE